MNFTSNITVSEMISPAAADDGLMACPVCHHENLREGPDNLVCAGCNMSFRIDRGIVDFRHVDESYRSGALRVDDGFEAPDPDALVEKKGAADVMVLRLSDRVRRLKKQFGELNLLDVGMFMGDGGGMKPFFKPVEKDIDLYVGIDPSPHEMYSDAERPENIRLMRSYGEYLPLRGNRFNFVVSIASMDHLFDADRCLKEIRRVMTPGGVFYTQLNNDGAWFKRMFPAAADRRREAASEWHNYFWTLSQYQQLLKEHGFEILDKSCYRYNPMFDNSRIAASLPLPLQSGMSRIVDRIGDIVLPGLGGNFAIACRLPG
jgi:SAM-dependent methyltransferase